MTSNQHACDLAGTRSRASARAETRTGGASTRVCAPTNSQVTRSRVLPYL